MKHKTVDNLIFLRLEKGELVYETLFEFCQKNNIKAGFLWALGSVKDVVLAHYSPDSKKYSEEKFSQILEAASLKGVISKEKLHLHAVLSDDKMQTIGGHLKEAKVAATLEVAIFKSKGELERYFDEDIGLELLKF